MYKHQSKKICIFRVGQKESERNSCVLNQILKQIAEMPDKSDYAEAEIRLSEGIYKIDSTIVIGEKLTDDLAISFVGEGDVIFSGGKQIVGGWEKWGTDGVYRHEIGENGIRQLYVDGERAVRARYPKKGKELFLQVEGEIGCAPEKRRMGFLQCELPISITKGDMRGAEIIFEQGWATSIAPISDREEKDAKVLYTVDKQISDPLWNRTYLTMESGRFPAYYENHLLLLDQENEWVCQDGYIYYKPCKDKNIDSAVFTVPETERLVMIEGKSGKKVKNVCFKNITFSYSGWKKPSKGYCEIQATNYVAGEKAELVYHPPAAIETRFAENILFEGCVFEKLGATAFNARKGSAGIRFKNVHVKDIAGTGLCFGYFDESPSEGFDAFYGKSDHEDCVQNIRVEDCLLTRIGFDLQGGSAICAGYVKDIFICHNEIFDISYSGIALGWGWLAPQTLMGNFHICNNRIYDTVNGMGYDGSEIYLVGRRDETQAISRIEGNYITCGGGLGGVYFDEGSNRYEMINNVIEGIGGYPLRHVVMNFHDLDCAEKNINVQNTYTTVSSEFGELSRKGGVSIMSYYRDGRPADILPQERGISVEPLRVKNGEWSKEAQSIIKNAGRRQKFK